MATNGGGKLTPEEKIAALLLKAETTTPEEAEALTEQASRLMIKYSITQAKLDAQRLGTDRREEIVIKNIELKGIYRVGYQNIMFAVVCAMGITKAFIEQPWNQKNVTIFRVVGYESDVEQLVVLLSSLQLQAVSALTKWWAGASDDYNGTAMQKFKARRQFLISFGNGAAARIEEARRAVFKQEKKSNGSGAELVLIDRESEIKNFLEAFGLKSINSRMSHGGNDAALAGYDAGKNANTGGHQVGGTREALNA